MSCLNIPQVFLNLPKLHANVKNVYEDENSSSILCDIYVYKDQVLHGKLLGKPFEDLLELEDFIRVKY